VLADLACVQGIFPERAVVLEQGAKSDPNLSLQIAVILVCESLAGGKMICSKTTVTKYNYHADVINGWISVTRFS